jgi:hypothetical protein
MVDTAIEPEMRRDHNLRDGRGEAMAANQAKRDAIRRQNLRDWAMADPVNAEIFRRLPELGLAQAYLVAGCVYQAVWNRLSGLAPGALIKDYDIFYFDGADLSWEGEDRVIRRAASLFADLGAEIEVKNQARVHLWYERRFGSPYPRLHGTRDGIDRYLVACTCIGIAAGTGEIYAPYGLDDLWDGVLRLNPVTAQPARFRDKALTYQARWPWLRIVEG